MGSDRVLILMCVHIKDTNSKSKETNKSYTLHMLFELNFSVLCSVSKSKSLCLYLKMSPLSISNPIVCFLVPQTFVFHVPEVSYRRRD